MKAALKWARLAIMFGHTLSIFTSKDLVRVVQKKKHAVCSKLEDEVNRERSRTETMRQYLQAQLGQHNPQISALRPSPQALFPPGRMDPYSPTTPTFSGAIA